MKCVSCSVSEERAERQLLDDLTGILAENTRRRMAA
jgi:hypothetical protein